MVSLASTYYFVARENHPYPGLPLEEEGETHQTSWLSVYGISARKRARLTAVDNWRW